jgi:outer membrane immunogenic protein
MRKIWTIAVFLTLNAVGAQAADLPVYTKAAPVAPPSWSGPYMGLSAGYGTGHSDQTDPGVVIPTDDGGGGTEDGHYSLGGGLVGATLGYSWQQENWVFGLEGDYSWANIHGSSPVCGPNTGFPHPCGTGLDALGTARGRLGYAMGPSGSVLPYITGGLAVGDLRGWDSLVGAEGSGFRVGWTVGVGVEAKIAPQWSAKIEYLHVDLGATHLFDVVPGVPETVSFRADILRAGVNYAFGSPTPAAVSPPIYTKAKAPVLASVADWSGFYLGADIGGVGERGGGISNFFQNDTDPAFANFRQAQSPGGTSFTGGFHAGYNWQFAPSFVLGIEGDWQWMKPRYAFCRETDIVSVPCFDLDRGFVSVTSETRSLATIRGRLGWTFDRFMVYGTGGVAFADISSSLTANCLVDGCGDQSGPSFTTANYSTMRTGWVAGAGLEWMLASNWMVRAEYLHADLGNVTNTLPLDPGNCFSGGPCGVTWSREITYDIVRFGASYKFAGPIVARY